MPRLIVNMSPALILVAGFNVCLLRPIWLFLSAFIAHTYQMNQWVVLLANVSGALILIEYFWKKHLGYQTKFKRKSLTKAILISVGITLVLAVVFISFFPDQLPKA